MPVQTVGIKRVMLHFHVHNISISTVAKSGSLGNVNLSLQVPQVSAFTLQN